MLRPRFLQLARAGISLVHRLPQLRPHWLELLDLATDLLSLAFLLREELERPLQRTTPSHRGAGKQTVMIEEEEEEEEEEVLRPFGKRLCHLL